MKKIIVPEGGKLDLQKLLVGHFIESVPGSCTKKITYVLQGDGLWEIRRNKLGVFRTHLYNGVVPGLKKTICEEPTWELNVPLIPLKLWDTTISFFKEIQKTHDTEAYLQFFYNTEEEEYVLHCPQQEVSKASVKYKTDPEFEKDKYISFMEIHSHGTMGAFFSGTDNADETSDRFYGVVGKITSVFPEYKFRLVLGGKHLEVDLFDLFQQRPGEAYPSDWVDRIKKEEPKFKHKKFIGKRNKEDEYEDLWGAQLEMDAFEEEEEDFHQFSLSRFVEKYGR